MIESAMSIALEDILGDTAALDESIEVAELSPLPPPPPPPVQHPDRTSALLQHLSISESQTDALRMRYQERQRRREQEQVEEASKSKQSAEFYRRITTARLEFEQRKLAIQSLRARIDREMQFLLATAQELEAREELIEDAFRGYEQLLRAEYGLEPDAHAG
ncbi:hypothetical protein Poli38472_001577 [Pythium oligandrum]|uniref:Uncharacterized protein n=1 Tax=Pythium oligandrum TaxID=41045 RepID=A0A8K1FNI3_PYTOL|nr:hypothetical protein Poli38472_001577 [Pythium oligandrum]|eukprot:TMW69421.1 hypothetical protein Poli38472_001577 [Pythium oligandrum]